MKISQGFKFAVLLSTLLWVIAGCGTKAPLHPEKIILGAQAIIHLSPVWIAERKGYFQEEALDVEIKDFASGRASLQTMLNDKTLDLTTTSQSPVIFNSFHRNDFAIIGGIVYSDQDIKILVRQDRGIKTPENLKGKMVGITAGTAGHFLLSSFLTYHQMQMSDTKIIDLEPPRLSQALIEGQVDAIVTWEPYISQAAKALGNRVLLLPSQGLFRDDIYLIARKDYLKDHTETLKRFIRAIEKGEAFILKNNDEAQDRRLVSAQENERERISYELHDNVWQNLVAIRMEIESLFSGQEDENRSKEVIAALLETVRKIRIMQGDLWPYVLDDIGLVATLNWYCREFEKNHPGLEVKITDGITESDIPPARRIVIYRILQEALNNVAKHSRADRVNIRLRTGDHGLELAVEDNGLGFNPQEIIAQKAPWGGLGLLNIKARTELSGGTFEVKSTQGKGTVVRAAWNI